MLRFLLSGFIVTLSLLSLVILVGCDKSHLTISMSLNNAEAIVLLAGSYEERSPLAVSLYHAGYAGCILLTDDGVKRGWSRKFMKNLSTTERGEEDLVKRGVMRQSIVKLPFWKSGTVYDALAVRNYVLKNNIRSILLVTSDYHTRRSLWIFQRVLRNLPVHISIAPASSNVSFFPEIALEYIKLLYYRIRFGVIFCFSGFTKLLNS